MTVETTVNLAVYRGNGIATQFAFPFLVFQEEDLVIELQEFVTGTVTHTYVAGEFTTTGIGEEVGGTVTILGTPITSDFQITIERIVDYTQTLDLVNQAGFYPEEIERQLDRTIMQIQQLRTLTDRSILVPKGEDSFVLPAEETRAQGLLGFDADGNPIILPSSELGSVGVLAQRREIIATAGQTTFQTNVVYTVGFVGVYVNGVRLSEQEFIALDGINVVLSNPVAEGDVVLLEAFLGSDTSEAPEFVNVRNYGATGDGVTNDTAAFVAAAAAGKSIYVPAGTYQINWTIGRKIIVKGDGSTLTIIRPFNDAVAAITYGVDSIFQPVHAFWTYHTIFEGIGFRGNSSKTGIGFTFARTLQADFAAPDQYVGGVTFRNCWFVWFNKAVQFPFGNIGTQFFDCGWALNKYGCYLLDNKQGGDPMHAGNKYFYNGEMSNNDCAVYLHDRTDGFGAVSFDGTIFEQNLIAFYLDCLKTYVPISFNKVWLESNGTAFGGTQTIDAWAGAVRSDQIVTNKTVIVAGTVPGGINSGSPVQFTINDGNAGDIHIKHECAHVQVNDSRVEAQTGFSGGPFIVDNPLSSRIELHNPVTNGGIGDSSYIPLVTGRAKPPGTMQETGFSFLRAMKVKPRGSKITSGGPSKVLSLDLVGAATLTGGFSMVGSVVSDGRIFGSCNEWTRAAWLQTEYEALTTPSSTFAATAGWYVFTIDLKIVSGPGLLFAVWDLGANQMSASIIKEVGQWQTYATIAYTAGGHNLALNFSGQGGTTVFRGSAFQVHKFTTFEEASSFVESGAFVV